MVPEGDPRPKRAKRRWVRESNVPWFSSKDGSLLVTRYHQTADGLRVERAEDKREQLIIMTDGVYILRLGKSHLIHKWGHGPGIYIPF